MGFLTQAAQPPLAPPRRCEQTPLTFGALGRVSEGLAVEGSPGGLLATWKRSESMALFFFTIKSRCLMNFDDFCVAPKDVFFLGE